MRCPTCDQETEANADFCTACGTSLLAAETGATLRLAANPQRQCPLCNAAMESGFIPDEFRDRNEQTTWVRGAPLRDRDTDEIDLAGAAMWWVETFRCTVCGFLASFAVHPIRQP